MATIHVLDDYYLAITLLITIAYQLFFFSIAFSFKFDKLTDFAGGTNFLVLSLITLSLSSQSPSQPHPRQIITSLFLMAWGLRLSAFLLYRILKTGTDTRFDDKRDKFLPFLGFWVAQMAWVWIVSLPVTILNSPAVTRYAPPPGFGTGADIAGVVLWVVGFALESVSDQQKFRFKMRVQSRDRFAVCDVGLFGWTRHPNYFGEILMQFAIFMMALSPSAYGAIPAGSGAYAAQHAAILGPVFLTVLLLFVSGLTLQERPGAKKRYLAEGPDGQGWKRYERWLSRTSILIPLPPAVYVRMPVWVKRSLLLEFPIYVFDPLKHVGEDEEVAGRGNGNKPAVGRGAEGDEETEEEEGRQQGGRESGEGLV